MPINTDPPPPCKAASCGHCNCFLDIDWKGSGCQWCQIVEENTKFSIQVVEANRKLESVTLERDAAQESCRVIDREAERLYERLKETQLHVGELRKLAIKLCRDSDNLFCKQPGCEGCEDKGITEKRDDDQAKHEAACYDPECPRCQE